MQRELNFKVWLPKEKEMLDGDFHIGSSGIVYLWEPEKDGYVNKRTDVILLQFTGLKDKNGKEIYEGDIVVMFDSPSNYSRKGDEVRIECQVIFEDGKFLPKSKDGYYNDYEDCHGGDIFLGHCWKSCKIIGNIYKNPELLKS